MLILFHLFQNLKNRPMFSKSNKLVNALFTDNKSYRKYLTQLP